MDTLNTAESESKQDTTIIVVGCGVFGLSTILELLRSGYENVLGLDVSDIPGTYSAASDLNKMIRVEYPSQLYAILASEALYSWESDPLYKPFYKKAGRLVMAPFKTENQKRLRYDRLSIENIRELGIEQRILNLNSPDEISKLIPEWSNNDLPSELSCTYNLDCGYAESAKSLVALYEKCLTFGARFMFGKQGTVTSIQDGQVTTSIGQILKADKIILAAGASTSKLVNLDNMVHAFGAFVTHIQLTDSEYEKYKSMPVFFSAEWGYFFPPDPDHHKIKIGLTYGNAFNVIPDPFNPDKEISLPKYINDVPLDSKESVKSLFSKIIPELADKEPVDSKICWLSDSFDGNFVIDYSPYFNDTVMVATGDSGHAYKFLPNIGKYIVAGMEHRLAEECRTAWGWRIAEWKQAGVSSRAQRLHYDVKTVKDWLSGSSHK